MRRPFLLMALVVGLNIGLIPNAPANDSGAIHPVPQGSLNALFYFNQRFIPEVAQSYSLDEATTITAMSFNPHAITWVDLSYFATPESQRHSMEMFKTAYTPIPTRATVTVWRSEIGDPGPRFDTGSGAFTMIARQDAAFDITLGSPRFITFDPPLRLSPGHYVVVLGMRFADANILTLHLGGRESGNSQMAGPLGDRFSECAYTRSSDLYPAGRAYKGTGGSTPYTGAADNYVGFGSVFVEHKAKVQECITVGKFDDIFNSGDLDMSLYRRTSTASPSTQVAAKPSVGSAPRTPPRLVRAWSTRAGSAQVEIRPSKETRTYPQVAIAFSTPSGATEVARCEVPQGRSTCTMAGIRPKSTVYVTVGARWNDSDQALAPRRTAVRVR